MNCEDFEDVVNELARSLLTEEPDRSTRPPGLAHVDTCARCAARLADERALSAGLRALAVSVEGKSAPAGLESMLLSAFRAQAPAAARPIARPAKLRHRTWPRMAWAAAVILIACGFVIYRSIQDYPRKDELGTLEKSPPRGASIRRDEGLAQKAGALAPARNDRAPQRRLAHRSQANRPFIRDSITAHSKDSEYLTDFYLLNYDADQRPMESGELIRVQMPRSALVRFGLPVNVERADVPVKADLLVGEDGLARAIRFVQ
jgi:hypothetical protein